MPSKVINSELVKSTVTSRKTKVKVTKRKQTSSKKKAPGAPTRFRTSYILFFQHNQKRIKKFLSDSDASYGPSVSKKAAEIWKVLPDEEKNIWKEAARKDKVRYYAESKDYKGPWKVEKVRTKKDPSAPKRNPSAFLLFSFKRRTELREENPELRNIDVSRLLGAEWKKKLSAEDKKPFIEREDTERKLYHQRMSEWKVEKEHKAIEVMKKKEVILSPLKSTLAPMENMVTPCPQHSTPRPLQTEKGNENIVTPCPQLSSPRPVQTENGNECATFFDFNVGDHFVGQDMMIDDLYTSLEESPFLPIEGPVDIDEWWKGADSVQDDSIEPIALFPGQERMNQYGQLQEMLQDQVSPPIRPSLVRKISDASQTGFTPHSDTDWRQFVPNTYGEFPSQRNVLTTPPMLYEPRSHEPVLMTPMPIHGDNPISWELSGQSHYILCNNPSAIECHSDLVSNKIGPFTASTLIGVNGGTGLRYADLLDTLPVDDCAPITTGYNVDHFFQRVP